MAKGNWKRRMLIGAAIGALVTLINRETREGAKEWGKEVYADLKEYKKQPSKAVQDLKSAAERVDRIAHTFVHELESAQSLLQDSPKKNEENEIH